MPIYEFQCNRCKKDFELLVYGNKKNTCPKCGIDDIRKKLSLFGMSGVDNHVQSGSSCGGCSKSSCSTC